MWIADGKGDHGRKLSRNSHETIVFRWQRCESHRVDIHGAFFVIMSMPDTDAQSTGTRLVKRRWYGVF
jgi:hypothetical protein